MYISGEYNCIFIHIPKTGGTVIKNVMLHKAHCKRIGYKHSKLKDYLKWPRLKDYFIFTFVRNPYARLVSRYRFHRISHSRKKNIDDKVRRNFTNFLQKTLDVGFFLQSNFIEHEYLEVDFIGKQENLQEDADKLCNILKMSKVKLPKKKKYLYYGEYDYMDYLNKNSIKFINRYARKDFKQFGYDMIEV